MEDNNSVDNLPADSDSSNQEFNVVLDYDFPKYTYHDVDLDKVTSFEDMMIILKFMHTKITVTIKNDDEMKIVEKFLKQQKPDINETN